MPQLSAPNIQAGPLRDLITELHNLHRLAGWPSLRDMARGKPFTYATVHDVFTKSRDRAPRLDVVLSTVEFMAIRVRNMDVDATLSFDEMWRAASERPFGAAAASTAPVRLNNTDASSTAPPEDRGLPPSRSGRSAKRSREVSVKWRRRNVFDDSDDADLPLPLRSERITWTFDERYEQDAEDLATGLRDLAQVEHVAAVLDASTNEIRVSAYFKGYVPVHAENQVIAFTKQFGVVPISTTLNLDLPWDYLDALQRLNEGASSLDDASLVVPQRQRKDFAEFVAYLTTTLGVRDLRDVLLALQAFGSL